MRAGRKIARLIGAGKDEVVVAASVSANLFKVVCSALRLRPSRRAILTDRENLPADLRIVEGAARQFGATVRRVGLAEVRAALDETVAAVVLPHVNYGSAAVCDTAEVARIARSRGATTVFDLARTSGALACDLDGAGADLAVGCGHKYLNGGPGAPAFLYVARRHLPHAEQPLAGWFAHEAPFSLDPAFRPAPDISRLLCGTPPILSMAALDAALDVFDEVAMADAEGKGRSLTGLFVDLFDEHLARRGFALRSGRERRRGSHVAVSHRDGQSMVDQPKASGFLSDFRAPDVLRSGFAPLHTRCIDVHGLVHALASTADREASARSAQFQDLNLAPELPMPGQPRC